MIRLLPAKAASATAVGWEIKAHDVLRARRIEGLRAQRLVREESAAHDWSRNVRACDVLRPAWAEARPS